MAEQTDKREALFTSAYYDFEKGLGTYAAFKVSNSALSEDLVQDTFIKTWTYLVKGGEITKMKAFLYHVLNGLIIDEYRKKKSTSLDVLLQNGFELSLDEKERDMNIFDGAKAIGLISNLPQPYQKIIRMRYVQELSVDEISHISGMSKNATAVYSHRGLEKLKTIYFNQQKIAVSKK
jgi:RNA polymerase sigma-70 factor (ECF subfamily)